MEGKQFTQRDMQKDDQKEKQKEKQAEFKCIVMWDRFWESQQAFDLELVGSAVGHILCMAVVKLAISYLPSWRHCQRCGFLFPEVQLHKLYSDRESCELDDRCRSVTVAQSLSHRDGAIERFWESEILALPPEVRQRYCVRLSEELSLLRTLCRKLQTLGGDVVKEPGAPCLRQLYPNRMVPSFEGAAVRAEEWWIAASWLLPELTLVTKIEFASVPPLLQGYAWLCTYGSYNVGVNVFGFGAEIVCRQPSQAFLDLRK